jgi:hypothetical protein
MLTKNGTKFDDEPNLWRFVAYWPIGAAAMFAGQWIAIHLLGVRLNKFGIEGWQPILSDFTVQLWMLGCDFGAAFAVMFLVLLFWAMFKLENGRERLIGAESEGELRFSAKFNITLRLCIAYGLSFGAAQLMVSWLVFLHDATAIPELVACFCGVFIGLDHAQQERC